MVDVPDAQLWLGKVFRLNHTRITYGMVLLFALFF